MSSLLEDNTTTIQEILDAVNALPEAGEGSDIETVEQATPAISVSSSGLITASATQTAGYVPAGTKSATKQLTTQAAQTITPGTSDKTISSGRYLTGTQTIKGDANLVAGNIKSGVSIFGVDGSYEGSGGSGEAPQWQNINTLPSEDTGYGYVSYFVTINENTQSVLLRQIENQRLDYFIKFGNTSVCTDGMWAIRDDNIEISLETDVINGKTVEYIVI